MSNSISNRYVDQLNQQMSDHFMVINGCFQRVQTAYSNCCLEENRSAVNLEELKKKLDALCAQSYAMHETISSLYALKRRSEFCQMGNEEDLKA